MGKEKTAVGVQKSPRTELGQTERQLLISGYLEKTERDFCKWEFGGIKANIRKRSELVYLTYVMVLVIELELYSWSE